MGRKRIHIARITSDKRRRATFTKRRRGLLKKAMELSILCECEVAVFIMAKDEVSVYTTNGDANETVQRALAMGPVVTHNGMYESLYYGNDDEDSLDDLEADEAAEEEPAGGSLTSKPMAPRAKRRRDQVLGAAAPEPQAPKRRAPLPRDSAKVATPHVPLEPSTPLNHNHAAEEPLSNSTNGDTTSALLQQMAILSQLLHQQTRTPNESNSLQGSNPDMVSSMSANLLGALKSSVDQITNGIHSPGPGSSIHSGNSPLMPLGELSPGMNGLSPHFPFAGLTPPTIPATLSPPSLDGHILDVNFSGSPARDIPSFHDLSTRLKPENVTLGATGSPLEAAPSLLGPKTRSKAGGSNASNNSAANGLGLRVSVPTAPRVFNIPPHLMSSTAPPTTGPILGNNSTTPNDTAPTPTSLTDTPTGDSSKFPPPPLLSSLHAPAFPFAPPNQTTAHNGDWSTLQSPLINPTNFNMYSPFLYSPRI